jgi:hypothetical protein
MGVRGFAGIKQKSELDPPFEVPGPETWSLGEPVSFIRSAFEHSRRLAKCVWPQSTSVLVRLLS